MAVIVRNRKIVAPKPSKVEEKPIEKPIEEKPIEKNDGVKVEKTDSKHVDDSHEHIVLTPMRRGIKSIANRTLEMLDNTDERVIQLKETDLKAMISNIMSELLHDFVRKEEVKELVNKAIQEMVIKENNK